MFTVGYIEQYIQDMEGFRIKFMKDGVDVRSDKELDRLWPGQKKSRGDLSVSEWRAKFSTFYYEYQAQIFMGDGTIVYAGQTKLKTVRDSYN